MRLAEPGKRNPVSKRPGAPIRYRSLAAEIDTTYLYNLGHDYEPLIPSLQALRAHAGKNSEIWLVLPPVTTAIADWQIRFAPKYPWPTIRAALRGAAERSGVRFIDYTDLLPSTTEFFKDTYHLSKTGSRAWTARFLEDFSRTREGNKRAQSNVDGHHPTGTPLS